MKHVSLGLMKGHASATMSCCQLSLCLPAQVCRQWGCREGPRGWAARRALIRVRRQAPMGPLGDSRRKGAHSCLRACRRLRERGLCGSTRLSAGWMSQEVHAGAGLPPCALGEPYAQHCDGIMVMNNVRAHASCFGGHVCGH